MIEGFEEFTAELTDQEKLIAQRVAIGLFRRVGGKAVISNKQIRKVLLDEGTKVADATMRKIIQYIRQHNLVPHLCSSSKGYYVASNKQEWDTWIKSMEQRIKAMQYTLDKAKQCQPQINFPYE